MRISLPDLPTPIIERLIYPGTCGIIAGAPKVGKTNFSIILAADVFKKILS